MCNLRACFNTVSHVIGLHRTTALCSPLGLSCTQLQRGSRTGRGVAGEASVCALLSVRVSPHRHGQLGHGSLESEQQPRLVEALGGVPMRAVAAGGWHSACVSDGGDLYVWGWNESGQLGLPSRAVAEEQAEDEDVGAGSEDPPLPGEPPGPAFISIQAFPALLDLPLEPAVAAVSCGSRHTAAVTRGGELYTWGWGKYGQLGHGDRASCDYPRRVEQLWAEGLQAQEVVCGPWNTYVCVLQQGGAQGSHLPSTALQAGTELGSCQGELSPHP